MPTSGAIIVFTAVVVAIAAEAAGQVSTDELVMTALKLATEYNSAARPPPLNGSSIVVILFVYVNSLVKVDSASQEVTLKFWLEKKWLDPRLAWLGKFNSSLDNVTSIFVPQKMIWIPDASVNNAIELKDVSVGDGLAKVSSDGAVLHGQELLSTIKCSMKLDYFPFDSQKCALRIYSRLQDQNTMQFAVKPLFDGDTLSTYMMMNNEFCITNLTLDVDNHFGIGSVKFVIYFRRRSAFYVINLIFPSVLLLFISVMAFRLPPECGERVSFSVTIVLSMCVFLQLAGNYTPTQSECVPLITWYFSAAVLLTMANVLCNTFVTKCQFKQHTSTRVTNRLIRALFLNRFSVKQSNEIASSDSANASSQPSVNQSSATSNCNEWKTVTSVADRAFGFLFLGFSIGLTFFIACAAIFTYQSACIEGLLR